MKYLWNCFWLTVPILVMNVALASRLPQAYQPSFFWRDIPRSVAIGEKVSRTVLFLTLLLIPLSIATSRQRAGLALYAVGVLIYFGAWAMQIWFPQAEWSRSRLGFMAPAWTPAGWLAGIALLGDNLYVGMTYHPWMFLALSLVFLMFHNAHVAIVYSRIHTQLPSARIE
ncbi:MAG: hypothetical protein U0Q16_18880 [Bryobacteraceae bacterium]